MGLTKGQKAIVENILVSAGNRADLNALVKAMTGDIKYSVSPATADVVHTADGWKKDIVISLVTADNEVHNWSQNAVTISIADTSTAGTATIAATTVNLIDGTVKVTISGNAAAWVAAETATLTVAQATILGYTVASKTCVITIS